VIAEFPAVFPAQILFLGFLEFGGFVPGVPVVFSLNHLVAFLVFLFFWGPAVYRNPVRSALNNPGKSRKCARRDILYNFF
jgi:hypothetical protein